MDKWIMAEDQLPEECKNVLVYIERDAWGKRECYRKKEIAIGWHIGGRWHVDGCSGVIGLAWMPLPKPPRIRRKTDGKREKRYQN